MAEMHYVHLAHGEDELMASVAATKLSDVLNPKSLGEPVNVHVVESVSEPQPDFEAMQRLIESGAEPATVAEPKLEPKK